MKLTTFVAALVAVFGLNAAAPDFETEQALEQASENSIFEKNFSRRFIPYVKLGPELTNLGTQNTIMPGAGIGIRSESTTSAVDCSYSYAASKSDDGKMIYHMFVPKLLYLKYLNSHSPSALFVGFGSTWAIIHNEVRSEEFNGIAGVLSAGMEYNRSSRIRQIYQIDVHQPVIGLERVNSWITPVVEMSFGLGF